VSLRLFGGPKPPLVFSYTLPLFAGRLTTKDFQTANKRRWDDNNSNSDYNKNVLINEYEIRSDKDCFREVLLPHTTDRESWRAFLREQGRFLTYLDRSDEAMTLKPKWKWFEPFALN